MMFDFMEKEFQRPTEEESVPTNDGVHHPADARGT